MYKLIIGLLLFVTIASCSEKNIGYEPINVNQKLLLLQVDFESNQFEKAIELPLSVGINNSDSIPLEIDYAPPSDFGSVKFTYTPSNEIIFDGTIIWLGKGEISYPTNFIDAQQFFTLTTNVALPDTQVYASSNVDYDLVNIWSAVSSLEIVEDYSPIDKKVVFFLYTPSVGAGNPADWDWFIGIYKE